MKFTCASYSDIGKRKKNEDSYNMIHRDDSLVGVVADGVGGCAGGEIASGIVADLLPKLLADKEFDEDELGYGILEAHAAICETKTSSCTTVAALWIQKDKAIAAHVGDSRIYQFRDGRIIYQSEDHSCVQVEISLGNLPADACRLHKDRNRIYQALGDEKDKPIIDTFNLDVLPGDRFLLCSDGFWGPVWEQEMIEHYHLCATPQSWLDAMTAKTNPTRITIRPLLFLPTNEFPVFLINSKTISTKKNPHFRFRKWGLIYGVCLISSERAKQHLPATSQR